MHSVVAGIGASLRTPGHRRETSTILAAKRKKAKHHPPRKWSEAQLRRLIRDEMLSHAEELAPHVLKEMLANERKRPDKLK